MNITNKIKKICVIGSGVMGSGIAALIANANCEVLLLDILDSKSSNRNSFGENAIEKCLKQKPKKFCSRSSSDA